LYKNLVEETKMEKKFFLVAAIVALLMLASFQIGFINVGKSDPARHTGDIFIGNLWTSELDTSQVLSEIDKVGIAHTNASDDWVYWPNRMGNVTANWTINVGSNHPEYYIIYTMTVYDVDNNCSTEKIGNVSYTLSILNNVSLRTSGTLKIAINFSSLPNSTTEVALVGWIGAYVKINNTIYDAKNFTSVTNDRCIVGVDFTLPQRDPPFSKYQERANLAFPHNWAWTPGWEDEFRFASEDDMLNNQTAFSIGLNQGTQQQNNDYWYMGNLSVYVPYDCWRLENAGYTCYNRTIEWKEDNGLIYGTAIEYFNVIDPQYAYIPIKFYAVLKATEPFFDKVIGRGSARWTQDSPNPYGSVKIPVRTLTSYDTDGDGNISVGGYYYGWTILPCLPVLLGQYNYKIHINNSINQAYSDDDTYYWEESVAYQNDTSSTFNVFNTTQSGVTTVHVNIRYVLQAENECVETFAADRGEMRVNFICM
jgi:hypothetical protein